MSPSKILGLAGAVLLTGAAVATAADFIEPAPRSGGHGGARIGTLSCDVGSGLGYVVGSSKELNCTFRDMNGETDSYSGEIRKLGVDLGYTAEGRLVWAVFAPTAGEHNGSLGGIYQGASAEVSVFYGAGANVLVGGTRGSIHLQLISVTGIKGLNLAAAGSSVTLRPAG